jgi:hypothetical protein
MLVEAQTQTQTQIEMALFVRLVHLSDLYNRNWLGITRREHSRSTVALRKSIEHKQRKCQTLEQLKRYLQALDFEQLQSIGSRLDTELAKTHALCMQIYCVVVGWLEY